MGSGVFEDMWLKRCFRNSIIKDRKYITRIMTIESSLMSMYYKYVVERK
jgi:hypothetical protein